MVAITWDESYRIIFSRYPFVGIFDRIAAPGDIEALVELEQRTNDRVRDEVGDLTLVAPEDRVGGTGTTPIMAAFTHTRPSRFTDGSFGVYYAASVLATAVAETVFHVESLFRNTHEPSTDVDMRAYCARINANFDDLRALDAADARLDPNAYGQSQAYARTLRERNACDGIIYRSVRDPEHRACVACFRPRNITACRPHRYLTYRWDGSLQRITDTFHRESLAGG